MAGAGSSLGTAHRARAIDSLYVGDAISDHVGVTTLAMPNNNDSYQRLHSKKHQ